MKRILTIGIILLTMIMSISLPVKAYTEEEKAQAKAWLSAHGYSPDRAGANQAYQDYLNGKFDEEIGVDVNGDGIPATTQATTEDTSEDTEEYVDADVEDEDGTTEVDGQESGAGGSAGTKEKTTEVAEGDDTENGQSKEQSLVESGEEEIQEEVDEDGMDAKEDEESTLYQPEKMEEYQTAAMVIVLAVVLMLLAGLWMKR